MKDKKLRTIGETHVLPVMVKMAEIILGKQYGDSTLSANTVGRCIENIAEDLKKQTTQCGRFAIHLAESTVVPSMSQHVVFARFCFNNDIQELFHCEPLKERCAVEDTNSTVNYFFSKNTVLWDNCIRVTTDRMAGCFGSFWHLLKNRCQRKVTEVSPNVKFIHCIVHVYCSKEIGARSAKCYRMLLMWFTL